MAKTSGAHYKKCVKKENSADLLKTAALILSLVKDIIILIKTLIDGS